MRSQISSFRANIDSVKALHSLHLHLTEKLPAIDLNDILRAEIVLIISAFDCFIHDVVRNGILDIFNKSKQGDTKYRNFAIPMSIVEQLLATTDEIERKELLSASVKKIIAKDSYQSSTGVENALQLIAVKGVWSSIRDDMSMPADEIKAKLGVIVHRRNQIAHEADVKNHLDISKNDISRDDVNDAIAFISRLVEAIDRIL